MKTILSPRQLFSCCLLFSCLGNMTFSQEKKNEPYGDWEIKEFSFKGIKKASHVGGRFVAAKESQTGEIIRVDGTKEAFKLTLIPIEGNAKLIRFEIATRWDELSAGGAGPRKGILRFLENGEMEMLETIDAGKAFPEDFSINSINGATFYKLTPAKQTPSTK